MFILRTRKDPPDKAVDLDARQNGQEIVSVNRMSVALCPHNEIAAFLLLMPEPAASLPSTSVSPASPNNDLISKEDQLIMTQTTSNNKTCQVEEESCERY